MKPKLKFMLDYNCNPLWGDDDYTRNKFGYGIDNLHELGLSNDTIELSEYLSSLHYEGLNPIYQILPSFWSGEMLVYFQNKVIELYKKIMFEIGDKFDIEISDTAKIEMYSKYNIESINNELEIYLRDPLKFYEEQGISNSGDYRIEKDLTWSEYMKWKKKEDKILGKNKHNQNIELSQEN